MGLKNCNYQQFCGLNSRYKVSTLEGINYLLIKIFSSLILLSFFYYSGRKIHGMVS